MWDEVTKFSLWSQVSLGSHRNRDALKFCSHAEELSGHAHDGDADNVDDPPGEGVRKPSVPPAARDQVEEMDGAGEVQAKLGPSYNIPESHRTVECVENQGCNKYFPTKLGRLQLLIFKDLIKRPW